MTRQTRQLSAIMFTDIVGYTAMMQVDEEKTLVTVQRYKAVQQEKISQYEGSTIKYYGDGSLTVFNSVLNAVNCALEIQRALLKSPKVPIRIGINTGDVLSRDGDVYGDGINIAARLQSFGDEGSIVFSGDVYDKIKNHPKLKSVYLGKHQLKNVLHPIDIYALSNPGIKVPPKPTESEAPEQKKQQSVTPPVDREDGKATVFLKSKKPVFFILMVVVLIAAIIVIGWRIKEQKAKQIALESILPELNNEFSLLNDTEGTENWRIYQKASIIKHRLGREPAFIKLWDDITFPLTIQSNQLGAKVYAKPYSNPDLAWVFLGETPVVDYPFPKGLSRIKVEYYGYETAYDVVLQHAHSPDETAPFFCRLFKKDEIPPGMVFVPGQQGTYSNTPGLPRIYIGDFWIDKYEVTNEQFKTFLNSGGYDNSDYWQFPFVDGADSIPFTIAIERFKDKTGWPGPANWELSDYPSGEGDLPVTGISWYEAAAYASFKNKSLPTIFHWISLSISLAAPEIVKFGNFDKGRLAKGGVYNSLTRFGTYDLPGNAAEWVFNTNHEKRYVLGGNFAEPSYWYNTTYVQASPWTRSELFGFRCIKYINDTLKNQLEQKFDHIQRDYNNLKPVSDQIFEVYKGLLQYESLELNSTIISTSESEYYTREIIAINVPYNEEAMKVLVFLPKNYQAPYQAILYFPGLDNHFSNTMENMKVDDRIDYYLKSGRAVIWPVYYASNGRGTINITNINDWKQAYRYILQDVRGAMDYLQTREDIDGDKIAYFGYSWGSGIAPYVLAVEDRIDLGILSLFGVSSVPKYRFKEFDQVDYLPRVKIPTLLLGGRYDFDFTLEQQQAFNDLLGTPETDKKWVICESTHYIPRNDLVNESLNWLDKYFGPVKRIN